MANKKLSLSKVTLRTLSETQLARVAGGTEWMIDRGSGVFSGGPICAGVFDGTAGGQASHTGPAACTAPPQTAEDVIRY